MNVTLQVKRPMSDGFPANVEYFKLGLDKQRITRSTIPRNITIALAKIRCYRPEARNKQR